MSLACLGLLTPPAQAQGGYPGYVGWVAQPVVVNGVTYPAAVSGTVKSTYTDAQGHTTTGGGPFTTMGGFASPGTFDIGAGISETYSTNGTVTYTWKWQGGTNNVPPPTAPQYILEQANAGAYGSGDILGTVTAVASDGLGDGSLQRSFLITTQSDSDMCSGKHLVTLDGSSGTLTVTGNLSAEMDLSEPKSSSGTLTGSLGCSYTASLDSRGVIITCPDIENSNASGPTPDKRAPSGAITVDSAVTRGGTVQTLGWVSNHGYWANIAGFVNPVVSWNPTGDGSLLTTGGNGDYYPGFWYFGESYGNFLNKSTTLTVTVLDSPVADPGSGLCGGGDGATATNTYTVRWHYPYENWQQNGAAFQNAPLAYPSKDGPQGAGGQVHIPIYAEKTDWSVAGKIGSGIVLTGAALAPETDPIILGFAAATGATLGSIDPPPPPTEYTQQGTLSQFQSDVSTELSIASGNTSGVFLPSQPRMDPKFANAVSGSGNYSGYFSGNIKGGPQGILQFNATAYRIQWQQNYSGDAYGVKGYVDSASSYVKWEGNWNYVFNWTWTPTGGPGPNG